MKNLFLFFCFFSVLHIAIPRSAQAAADPRIKALGSMALYGTIGGALLGTASLAFGTGGRSVAKGASLGLYAGLLFGSYVVISHAWKQKKASDPAAAAPIQDESYYPDTNSSPYEQEGEYYPDDYQNTQGAAEFWTPYWELEAQGLTQKSYGAYGPNHIKPAATFFVPVLLVQF